MKLIYKGSYKSDDQLPKGTLPPNAVKFKEPETTGDVNKTALLVALPVLLVVVVLVGLSYLIHGTLNIAYSSWALIISAALSLLAMPLHEWLHAVCFGKNSEVELFIAPAKLMLFVVCTKPITKSRFIFMSLFPALVLGWLPFLLWVILPYQGALSNYLFYFSVMQILGGVGDYLNIFNALRQMPKGSMQ